MPNTNCLTGMRCPKCGSEGPFWIEAVSSFLVFDCGIEEYRSVDWQNDSHCECDACSHCGYVADFTIKEEKIMNTYNVHIYREMRLFFPGIEAPSHEKAASLASQKPDDDAALIDDCDGKTLSALVDVVGDEDYSESVMIDLNHESQITKAQAQVLDLLRRGKATISGGDLEYNGTVYAFDDTNPDWAALCAAIMPPAASPTDPDGKNDDRAAWAEYALTAFMSQTGADLENALCDLLGDLMHLSDRAPFDFEAALQHARDHYLAETGQPGPLTD